MCEFKHDCVTSNNYPSKAGTNESFLNYVFPFNFLSQIFSLSALFALIAVATAQFGFNGDFGGPSGFSAGFPSAALTTGARDPRQNRGNQG